MEYNKAVEAICEYIDTDCKHIDIEKEIKRLELEDKLLFALGLAVFQDYEIRKKNKKVIV